MGDTNLSQAISAADDSGPAYDTNVKFLLSDKQILSWILKYTLDEFKDMDVSDIRDCIGNDIEVDTRPVEPGLSNLGRIKGTLTEDNVPGEGAIYYDIRFTAYHRNTEMKILVNLEAQRTSDANKLGYHLENRIVFYLARMVSAQKQTEFFHSDFDDLKPVRSIWICMDSGVTEDSIEEIGFESRLAYGNTKNRHETDLMKGIIINIRNQADATLETAAKSGNRLIAMLEEILSEKAVSEKKKILADEYGMIMTEELEGRIRDMCNLSELVEERGIKKGIREGIKEGILQGVAQERIAAIERMMKADITNEQIISCGYTEEEIKRAESKLYVNV